MESDAPPFLDTSHDLDVGAADAAVALALTVFFEGAGI